MKVSQTGGVMEKNINFGNKMTGEIKISCLSVLVLVLALSLMIPPAFSDNSKASQDRRAQRDQNAQQQGGVRPASELPTDEGLQHPMTFLGGGRWRDANGVNVQLVGPDGNERWEYENMDDYWKYKEANDPEWPAHKGKFPGTYQEWKELQQYKDPGSDLWGPPGTDYDWMKPGVDSSSIHGVGTAESGNTGMQNMEGMESR